MGKRFGPSKPSGGTKAAATIFLSALLITLTCVFGGNLSQYLNNLALICVGIVLPEGGKSAVREMFMDIQESGNVDENESQSDGTEDPDTDSGMSENAADKSYLTKTPDDIVSLMLQAEKDSENQEEGGKTLEKTFSSADATEAYELVCVKNVTESKNADIQNRISNGIDIEISDKSQPTVLIYHTHTTESYCLLGNGVFPKGFSGKTEDSGRNMVRVGDEIAGELERAGFTIIHETRIFDKSYNDAYDLSREVVQEYLEKYPSIQITLDVHRDAIHYSSTSYAKPTAEVMGKKAAQIMIITGAEEGRISDFPNWEQNLDFALTLFNYAENMYGGLMKPIFFCQRKYNMDLGKYSLLLEMGTDANTLEEAVYSGRLIGNVLATVLSDYS